MLPKGAPKYTWILGDTLHTVECEIIKSAYEQLDGNMMKIAELLGISKATVYRKVQMIYGPEFYQMRADRYNRNAL